MKDELRRPRTLILPPAPYAAAILGGWWLDRAQGVLPLDIGAATHPLGWLAIGVGLALFVWTLWTFARHRTTVNPYGGRHMPPCITDLGIDLGDFAGCGFGRNGLQNAHG